jgi:hypothetical protein
MHDCIFRRPWTLAGACRWSHWRICDEQHGLWSVSASDDRGGLPIITRVALEASRIIRCFPIVDDDVTLFGNIYGHAILRQIVVFILFIDLREIGMSSFNGKSRSSVS